MTVDLLIILLLVGFALLNISRAGNKFGMICIAIVWAALFPLIQGPARTTLKHLVQEDPGIMGMLTAAVAFIYLLAAMLIWLRVRHGFIMPRNRYED